MSRLAKKPISIPEGVTVTLDKGKMAFTGPKGAATFTILPYIEVRIEGNLIVSSARGKHAQARANWGTTASLIKNALTGVKSGFTKTLEFEGIGFRAALEGQTLVLTMGFTHPVRLTSPEGITITVAKNVITVSGVDKALVGQIAADIRAVKPPEPYLGKGIRYQGEVVRRKPGKKVAGTGTGAVGT